VFHCFLGLPLNARTLMADLSVVVSDKTSLLEGMSIRGRDGNRPRQ